MIVLHMSLAVLLAAVIMLRIFWRLTFSQLFIPLLPLVSGSSRG